MEPVRRKALVDAALRVIGDHGSLAVTMGAKDDPMAVVDPQTRVIGVDGLRVADSSIFPHVTYGNLNGPSIASRP